jgi:hypothetical protein
MTTHQLSAADAERLRAFAREGQNALATSYYEFFTPAASFAAESLFDAVHLRPGIGRVRAPRQRL